MEKTRNSSLWIEEGYNLFAKEGLEGIQVERLARILQLNKSGFYHYFGDLEVYCAELLCMHEKKADVYLSEIKRIKTIDPEYLLMISKHKVSILFQMQLIRNKNPTFYKIAETIDQNENVILRKVWSDYIGFQNNPDLAIRYFNIVRDMFYTRMSFQNLHYPFLHNLMTEAKDLIQQIAEQQAALVLDESRLLT